MTLSRSISVAELALFLGVSRTTEDALVYIVGPVGSGLVKIGFTRRPEARFAAMRTNNHAELALLALVPGSRDTERALHARFAPLRDHGEWYRFEGELVELVSRIRDAVEPSDVIEWGFLMERSATESDEDES